MTCQRCGGLMLAEQYDDQHAYTVQAEFTGWRCVNCGTVLDPVIRANRDRPSEKIAQWA
jgi:ribosomal protein S27AE